MKFRALRNWLTAWSVLGLLVFGIAVFAAFPGTASAQVGTAINGTVRDASGAVIPDAKVVLHNSATKLDLSTTTNSSGAYAFPSVQPGTYDIRVSIQGFNSAVESDLTVVVNQIATYDVTLKTGSITDTVNCIGGCHPDSYKFNDLTSNDIMLGMRWRFPPTGFVAPPAAISTRG